MKKLFIAIVIIGGLVIAVGLYWYKNYFPDMIAEAVVSDQLPPYIPKYIQVKIEEFRKPVNAGAENMVVEMHRQNIPVEKIVETIDKATEQQTYAFLDELNAKGIKNTDQVFDIGKKYFPADYDVEVFREPFKENVDLRTIRKGIHYANVNRRSNDISIPMLKEIAKKILLQKEKDYRNGRIAQ
jgi:hypothetical protein